MPILRHVRVLFALSMMTAAGCSGDDGSSAAPEPVGGGDSGAHDAAMETSGTQDAAGDVMDSSTPDDAGADALADGPEPDAADPCPRLPGPDDKVRKVVVAHPYDAAGGPSPRFEVLALSTAGQLSATGEMFEMGRAFGGEIAFTPDGEVGIAVHDDGTLGVFRFNATGQAEVVQAQLDTGVYAAKVVIAPDGHRAFVLDSQWVEHGGGVYAYSIACDGSLSLESSWLSAKLPYGMSLLPDGTGRSVLAATEIPGSSVIGNLFLLSDSAKVLSGVDVFGDQDSIVSAVAITSDSKHVLVGDNSLFGVVPNRVAVARIEGDGLVPVQVLSPIEDPVAIVASPFDNAAMVVSGFGNAIFALDYEPGDVAEPFVAQGELVYQGGKPQLPGSAILIDRGSLRGLVLVSENVGVRRVQFTSAGAVEDKGAFAFGEGYDMIAGAIGVQP